MSNILSQTMLHYCVACSGAQKPCRGCITAFGVQGGQRSNEYLTLLKSLDVSILTYDRIADNLTSAVDVAPSTAHVSSPACASQTCEEKVTESFLLI